MTTKRSLTAAVAGMALATLPTAGKVRKWGSSEPREGSRGAVKRRLKYKAQRQANRARRKLLQERL